MSFTLFEPEGWPYLIIHIGMENQLLPPLDIDIRVEADSEVV